MESKRRKSEKQQVGRPEERVIDPIPDTLENLARALFGKKSDNPDIEAIKQEYRKRAQR